MHAVDSVPIHSINHTYPLNTVEEALDDLRNGKMVILIDREDRENEGDFVCAAEHCTPEIINFMATHGKGLICVPMLKDRLEELQLKQMVDHNTEYHGTAFTISCDLLKGNTTGISAFDRSNTIRALVNTDYTATDFCRPGHIFPLQAKEGGVLVRSGQTEGSIDLCKLAGLYPGAVICEIMNPDGTMARMDSLLEIANQFSLKLISVPQIIEYRSRTEKLVSVNHQTSIQTPYGIFELRVYESDKSNRMILALTIGTIMGEDPVLVRVQNESPLDDVFHALSGKGISSLAASMRKISQEERGAVIYICHTDRKKQFSKELRDLAIVQQHGTHPQHSTEKSYDEDEDYSMFSPKSDLRTFGFGAQVIKDLGIQKIRLLTNSLQRQIIGLKGFGLEVVEKVPIFNE